MNNTVAQLAINRLTVIPFTIHPVLQESTATELRNLASIVSCPSYVL